MTTLDLDSLHAALDLDPGDQFTRRVLADWHEEAGVLWMAEGLRWVAEREARYDPTTAGWMLVFSRCLTIEERREYFRRVPTRPDAVPPTRRAAEEALCRALARLSEPETR